MSDQRGGRYVGADQRGGPLQDGLIRGGRVEAFDQKGLGERGSRVGWSERAEPGGRSKGAKREADPSELARGYRVEGSGVTRVNPTGPSCGSRSEEGRSEKAFRKG